MAKKSLPSLKVTHKGAFSFKDLYGVMYEFLKQNSFTTYDFPEFGGGDDQYEFYFLVKGSGPKNYKAKWKAKKIVPDTNYFRYTLEIEIEGKGISQKEIVVDGKKLNVDDGEVTITMKGDLETDFKKEWEKHWLLKHFQGVYDKRILKEEIEEEHEGGLMKTLLAFQNTVKRYFRIQGGKEVGGILPQRPG